MIASQDTSIPRFERLERDGRIDRDSGAWNFDTNQRAAHCGRCRVPIPAGEGAAYNELMRDGYRASTRYLCPGCAALADVKAEVPQTTGVPQAVERPAPVERFFCPECGAYVNGPETRHCGVRPERDVIPDGRSAR